VLSRLKARGVPLHYTTTATTRPKREVRPEDHEFLRFLTDAEFDDLLASDGLLEHANVYGKRYGVPKGPVREALASGKDVVMRVDVQGAASIKRLFSHAVLVFLRPSSLEELEARLRARALDDSAAVERRLARAVEEMERQHEFDYTLTNEEGRLEQTVDELLEIIEKERTRPGRPAIEL
jgi:guanylate kinase